METKYDGRIETEDVTLGYALTVYLYTDTPAAVTVVEYQDERGVLRRREPQLIQDRRWDYPFLDGEEGFVLHTNDGREGVFLVRHGRVYQLGGSLRMEYAARMEDLEEVP